VRIDIYHASFGGSQLRSACDFAVVVNAISRRNRFPEGRRTSPNERVVWRRSPATVAMSSKTLSTEIDRSVIEIDHFLE
jgi:hypothetical protein